VKGWNGETRPGRLDFRRTRWRLPYARLVWFFAMAGLLSYVSGKAANAKNTARKGPDNVTLAHL